MDRKFKVIENRNHSGLTVGSYSRKPGYIFIEKQWNGNSESLEIAIENKRCVEIKEKKEESKKRKEFGIKKDSK